MIHRIVLMYNFSDGTRQCNVCRFLLAVVEWLGGDRCTAGKCCTQLDTSAALQHCSPGSSPAYARVQSPQKKKYFLLAEIGACGRAATGRALCGSAAAHANLLLLLSHFARTPGRANLNRGHGRHPNNRPL